MRTGLLLIAFLTFAALRPVNAEDIAGRVVRVTRGDLLTVQSRGRLVRIRLAEIIAPRPGQPFSKRSAHSLSEICLGKRSFMQVLGNDREGAPIGQLWCEGVFANAEQVRRGMAWVFSTFAGRRSPLASFQEEARTRRYGIWSPEAAMPHWPWYQSHARTTRL